VAVVMGIKKVNALRYWAEKLLKELLALSPDGINDVLIDHSESVEKVEKKLTIEEEAVMVSKETL
jgi:hypothetical protein